MSNDPLRPRALACLREGRVTILGVKLDAAWRPVRVVARVRSSRDRFAYRVQLRVSRWECNCAAGQKNEPCAHTLAVSMVTAAEVAP